MRATIGLQSHAFLVMGANLGLIHLNSRLNQGLGTWSGGLATRGIEVPEGGL